MRTQHASGAHADTTVSLSSPDYVEEVDLLGAEGRVVSLVGRPVDAVVPFARALDGLVAEARGLAGPGPAPLDLGVEITRVLAQAEERLRRS